MKVGFLTSYRAQEQFEQKYHTIVDHLEKRGHEVVHSLDTSLEELHRLDELHREQAITEFYKKLESCDVVLADCSFQSTQVGFGLSYLRSKGKPIVMLYDRGQDELPFSMKGAAYLNVDNVVGYEYEENAVGRVLDDALLYMGPRIDKRFTIIFPSELLAKVEERAQKLAMPKSVYIRQLIEKDVASSVGK